MKPKILIALLLICVGLPAEAQVQVLVFPNGTTNSITVGTNESLRVVGFYQDNGVAGTAFWTFRFGTNVLRATTAPVSENGGTKGMPGGVPSLFPGPATVEVGREFIANATTQYLFYEIVLATPLAQAANTVVIPDDGGGPVQIILEQSTDLITWTAANPGSFGTTTSKRFFRLRAVRQ